MKNKPQKQIKNLTEECFDKWRDLDYSLEYMYFSEEIMEIIKNVVASERRKNDKTL